MSLHCACKAATVHFAHRYARGTSQGLATDNTAWRSSCLFILLLAAVALPLPLEKYTNFRGAEAVYTPRGDITVCSSKVLPERVAIALSSAPFGSVRCTTHRITTCDLQQGLTIMMPPERPHESAVRPLLRVFIEGSTLRRQNIAGDLATLEIMSGVPDGGAGPATDPSQYYSFELTIRSTVITASVTNRIDSYISGEGAFALRFEGITLTHSTVDIQETVVAAEKRSGTGAAVGLWFRDCHLGFGTRVWVHNTTIGVSVSHNDRAGGRGFHFGGSSLSNGASLNIAKSNITVKVSGTYAADAMAFVFENGPISGETTQISFFDSVIDLNAATGAGYGLRVANASVADGATFDVYKCGATVKADRWAVLFARDAGAQMVGPMTRLSFVEVDADVASSSNIAFGFYCYASETTDGAAIIVHSSTVSVNSGMEATAWHFGGGSLARYGVRRSIRLWMVV